MGDTTSLFLKIPGQDNCCPCYSCWGSKILALNFATHQEILQPCWNLAIVHEICWDVEAGNNHICSTLPHWVKKEGRARKSYWDWAVSSLKGKDASAFPSAAVLCSASRMYYRHADREADWRLRPTLGLSLPPQPVQQLSPYRPLCWPD